MAKYPKVKTWMFGQCAGLQRLLPARMSTRHFKKESECPNIRVKSVIVGNTSEIIIHICDSMVSVASMFSRLPWCPDHQFMICCPVQIKNKNLLLSLLRLVNVLSFVARLSYSAAFWLVSAAKGARLETRICLVQLLNHLIIPTRTRACRLLRRLLFWLHRRCRCVLSLHEPNVQIKIEVMWDYYEGLDRSKEKDAPHKFLNGNICLRAYQACPVRDHRIAFCGKIKSRVLVPKHAAAHAI
jgi:hypothetical protein